MATVPTTYDADLALVAEQTGAPLQYLRALSWMESAMNPANKTGKHWGLFQIPPEVVADYNKAHPPAQNAFAHEDMLRPVPNMAVFSWDLQRILRAYRGYGIPANWRSKDFAKLVTMGWNAGWSKAAGVGKVAAWLKANGKPVTHANVKAYAKVAGGIWSLQSPTKFKWQGEVAALYQRLASSSSTIVTEPADRPSATKTGEWTWLAILILVAAALSRKS